MLNKLNTKQTFKIFFLFILLIFSSSIYAQKTNYNIKTTSFQKMSDESTILSVNKIGSNYYLLGVRLKRYLVITKLDKNLKLSSQIKLDTYDKSDPMLIKDVIVIGNKCLLIQKKQDVKNLELTYYSQIVDVEQALLANKREKIALVNFEEKNDYQKHKLEYTVLDDGYIVYNHTNVGSETPAKVTILQYNLENEIAKKTIVTIPKLEVTDLDVIKVLEHNYINDKHYFLVKSKTTKNKKDRDHYFRTGIVIVDNEGLVEKKILFPDDKERYYKGISILVTNNNIHIHGSYSLEDNQFEDSGTFTLIYDFDNEKFISKDFRSLSSLEFAENMKKFLPPSIVIGKNRKVAKEIYNKKPIFKFIEEGYYVIYRGEFRYLAEENRPTGLGTTSGMGTTSVFYEATKGVPDYIQKFNFNGKLEAEQILIKSILSNYNMEDNKNACYFILNNKLNAIFTDNLKNLNNNKSSKEFKDATIFRLTESKISSAVIQAFDEKLKLKPKKRLFYDGTKRPFLVQEFNTLIIYTPDGVEIIAADQRSKKIRFSLFKFK